MAYTQNPGQIFDQGQNAPYRIIPGDQIGKDNNYSFAKYADGHVEPVYATQGTGEWVNGDWVSKPRTYKSLSEMQAEGLQPTGTDAHGIPTFDESSGYTAASGHGLQSGGSLNDILGMATLAVGGYGALSGLGAAGSAAGDLSAADAATLGDFAGGTADAVGTGGDLATVTGGSGTAVGGGDAALTGTMGYTDAAANLAATQIGVPGLSAADLAAISEAAGNGGILSSLGLTGADLTRLGGALIPGALGLYGSNELGNQIHDISQQNRNDRAPFLSAATGYLNDPASYFAGPGGAAIDAALRKLSVTGNPFGSPFKMEMAGEAGLNSWLSAVTGIGGIGTGGETTNSNLALQGAMANASGLNALGYGISNALNPPFTLSDYLRMQSQNKPGVT
jgi:hypothetical protein